LIGRKFGKLSVIEEDFDRSKSDGRGRKWKCTCECGAQVSYYGGALKARTNTTCKGSKCRDAFPLNGGEVYNSWTVLNQIKKMKVWYVMCRCVCGVKKRNKERSIDEWTKQELWLCWF
jgi:hypothetical protein